ncbi:leucine-rich repeat domain-containing protein [Leptospira santarosai]|uniref:leucine-rich repeat domain-containing protein n=1 Tax=Leptospira santarosai TaxID=28183 RepID=UPI00095B3372|nr:leucine-rich repeat domain-containing protein [Leptospira santarosai]MBW9231958.1 leucine-rich repeat domain-containing protein [Leptospira santarosai]MDI7175340.1 leucine-rich repeat domain-containing protein [Leptospira santarosai]MDI7194805.1 leucine-rich repeat domain-containing protein [Leptospira santarosai]MDO6384598.1 leucine-rich repeat domain-containing protein [Leptospira santarosai]MDO6394011.1 leucine-rich repeat domain-containing protein [Leptospira santarosai]
MKRLAVFLIYLIGSATCTLYADPQDDLVKSIYATLEKKGWVEKRFAFIVLPDGPTRCEDRLRNRKLEERLAALMENLGAKNYVKDFSVDEEKSSSPERTRCPMALYKTEKIDCFIMVNVIAGVYKGYLYSLKPENRMFVYTFGATNPSLQTTLRLGIEGKEPIELKIHKDVRNLNMRSKYLDQIIGMRVLTDLETINVSDLDLQNIPRFDFDRPYRLEIFNNYIKDIHASDFDPNAFHVDISWNLLEDDVWFCDTSTIREINVVRNKLRSVDCLLSNDHVETVKSSFNYISNISSRKIGKSLKSLDLSYNGLRSFPWKMFNESGMKDLDLSNNQLYDIAMIDLSTIERVDLSKNPILKVVIGEKSKNLKILRVSPKTVVEFKNPISRCASVDSTSKTPSPEKNCVKVEYE